MIELRPHQETFIEDIRVAMRAHQSVLAQAPTGFGKTIVAAFMAMATRNKGRNIIFTCHRQELIDQTSASFIECGIKHGFVAAGRPFDPDASVKIASIQTLKNRVSKIKPPDLLVVDECHHCAAAGWAVVVNWARVGGARIIGLTATPWRLSGEGLAEHFGTMVLGPTVAWLIENRFLSDYRAFAPGAPVLDGVRKRAGDYVRSDLESIMDDSAIMGDAVKHYLKHARGKKGLVFCVSVKHSENVASRFRAAGVSALHLDAKTPREERRRAVMAFADGHVDILSNVELFGEGFDLSSLAGAEVPIECVSLLRPTMSLSLYLQQVGRALRPKGHPAIILDHAGNIMKHGFPDDEREWTLAGRPPGKTPAKAIKQCPNCYFCHNPATICPDCGHIYEIESRVVDEVDGELGEIDVAARRRHRMIEQGGARSIPALIALGKERGYSHPQQWAAKVYTARLRGARSSPAAARLIRIAAGLGGN